MSDWRPLDTSDYLADDLALGPDAPPTNQLLDRDGEPSKDLTEPSLQGLAAIAAALDRHAPSMTPQHLEKAVWWIKAWKAARAGTYRRIEDGAKFHRQMSGFKESKFFKRSASRARRLSYVSHLFALVAGIAMLGALQAWLEEGEWGGKTMWTIGLLVSAALAAGFRDAARDVWQQQDRWYFLQCLRSAQCTEDLLDAGFFSHHDATMKVTTAEEYLASRRAFREIQRQFADALYFDDECRIREQHNERDQAYSWNWKRA